jgi:hypothetical protein
MTGSTKLLANLPLILYSVFNPNLPLMPTVIEPPQK